MKNMDSILLICLIITFVWVAYLIIEDCESKGGHIIGRDYICVKDGKIIE